MALNCGTLIVGQGLSGQPSATEAPEQIGVRTLGDQMSIEDRVHFVLDPRTMTDELIAPRVQPTIALSDRIRHPNLWQVAGGIEVGQCAGVDLVGLHMGVRDGFHLERVGDHHALHEWRQHPRHGHAVAGRLDHHLIRCQKAFAEAFQCRSSHIDTTCPSKPTLLPENHLPKGSVSIYPDYASHARLLFVQRTGAAGYTTTTDSRSRRNRASRRGGQLLTRARSSTYKIGLPAPSCSRRLCPGWSHHMPRSRKPQPDIGAGTLIPVTNILQWKKDGLARSFTLTWMLSMRPSSSATTRVSKIDRWRSAIRRSEAWLLQRVTKHGALGFAPQCLRRSRCGGVPILCSSRLGSRSTAPSLNRSMRSSRTTRPWSSRSLLTRPTLTSLTI